MSSGEIVNVLFRVSNNPPGGQGGGATFNNAPQQTRQFQMKTLSRIRADGSPIVEGTHAPTTSHCLTPGLLIIVPVWCFSKDRRRRADP